LQLFGQIRDELGIVGAGLAPQLMIEMNHKWGDLRMAF
jgi:hypothetical protein